MKLNKFPKYIKWQMILIIVVSHISGLLLGLTVAYILMVGSASELLSAIQIETMNLEIGLNETKLVEEAVKYSR